MTDQQIIIEVAKLDGQVFDLDDPNWVTGNLWLQKQTYLTSRDAIIPVIEKHINTNEEVWNFSVNLSKILTETDEAYHELSPVDYIIATARQLSIALLKATGKWTEE